MYPGNAERELHTHAARWPLDGAVSDQGDEERFTTESRRHGEETKTKVPPAARCDRERLAASAAGMNSHAAGAAIRTGPWPARCDRERVAASTAGMDSHAA